jgi:hypothetical protein
VVGGGVRDCEGGGGRGGVSRPEEAVTVKGGGGMSEVSDIIGSGENWVSNNQCPTGGRILAGDVFCRSRGRGWNYYYCYCDYPLSHCF